MINIKKYLRFQNNKGITPYIWIILCILPFYYIAESTSLIEIIIGILIIILFFIIYRIAFIAKGWSIYIWTYLLILISTTWIILFHYVYLSFFLAYYIGNVRNRIAFFVLYISLLVTTSVAIPLNFLQQNELFLKQIPFVVVTWISVILLPFSIRNRNEVDQLEAKLQHANQKIAELIKIEERERIARDLHDTLGQKLSLIGLKSDLARKLIYKNPEQAKNELKDVQQTARTALNEVRKLVSSIRTVRLNEELVRVRALLHAANIEYIGMNEVKLTNGTLLTENILSMCLKEAVNNVVKHSGATQCIVSIEQSWKDIVMTIKDDGTFKQTSASLLKGHGLIGMRERVEFANGSIEIDIENGTTLVITVPNDVKQKEREELA
ncbi:MAG: sensor histidine kinase [Bacillaceae bacterium]